MSKEESPALTFRSEHYPASWYQKVPTRIRMAKIVMSDLPMFVRDVKPMVAHFGSEYDCWVNSHGAVAAILEDGRKLGVKPYEFEVIGWAESAESAVTEAAQ